MNWWETVDWQDPINRDCPLNAGVLGWWMGAPGLFGGTRLWDLTNRNHGTLTNMDPATDWVNSERGPVLGFDGSNDRVDTAALSTTGPMTYAARIRVTNTSTHCIFGWSSISAISFRTNGTSLQLINSFSEVGASSSVLTTGVWCNVGARYTPGSNSWGISLNGRLVASGTTGATLVANATLTIGWDPIISDLPFKGDIQHLIYCRGVAWSDNDFAQHHVQSLAGFPDMLNHYRRRAIFLPPADTGNRRRRLLICGAA